MNKIIKPREKFQWKKIIKIIEEPEAFFDIGVGSRKNHQEAQWAKRDWKNCKIIGLEPSKRRYDIVESTFPGVLLNIAASEIDGKTNGFFGIDFKTECSKKELTEYIAGSIESTTLDSLNNKYGLFKTIFVWADIEGSELRLLHGAVKLLKNKTITGLNLELNKYNFQDIIDYLEKFGYFSIDFDKASFRGLGDYIFIPK